MTTYETRFPADVRVVQTLRVDGRFPTIHRTAVGPTNTTWTDEGVTHLGVNSLTANMTLTLGTLGSDFASDLVVTVKDETGLANPTDRIITVAGNGGDTIDGYSSIALTVGHESVTLYGVVSDGAWFIQ